jgi:large subunit ribosomal protein LP0
MTKLLEEYNKIVIVGFEHVGSHQMQKIRIALRGMAVCLNGKNTLMRKVINKFVRDHPGHPISELNAFVVGNVGFIFTNGDITEIRKVIDKNRVPAAARVGVFAERDVVVPPGPTGCDPGQTSWFQALNVPTKISKGQIEIVSELHLIKKGDRVGASEAGLLTKLNIKPFTYGLTLETIYDNGAIFEAKVLDITKDVLRAKFLNSVRRVAAISLATGYPTLASLPHSIGRSVKRMLAITAVTGVSLGKVSEKWDKLFTMDPEELKKLAAASASASAAAAPAAGGGKKEEKKVEKKEEAAEIDMGGGGGLFGDDAGY